MLRGEGQRWKRGEERHVDRCAKAHACANESKVFRHASSGEPVMAMSVNVACPDYLNSYWMISNIHGSHSAAVRPTWNINYTKWCRTLCLPISGATRKCSGKSWNETSESVFILHCVHEIYRGRTGGHVGHTHSYSVHAYKPHEERWVYLLTLTDRTTL